MTTMEVSHERNGHAAEQVWPSIGEGVLNLPNPITEAGAWVPAEEARRIEADAERVRAELAAVTADRDMARATVARLETEDRDRNEAAREWADENNLCSQFERFCDAYGWEGRTVDLDLTVRVTLEVTVRADEVARGDQGHCSMLTDRIDRYDVFEAIRDADSGIIDHYEVTDWDQV